VRLERGIARREIPLGTREFTRKRGE